MSDLRDLAEELVEEALSVGADDAIAEVMDYRTHQVRFSASRIDASNWWAEKHGVLFVAVGKKALTTDIGDLSRARDTVRDTVSSAKRAPRNEEYFGIASGRFRYARPRPDKRVIGLRSPVRYVHRAISAAASEGATEVGGTLFARHRRMGIASSGGAKADDESTSVELSVRAFCQPEASGHALSCSPRLSGLDAKGTGSRAGILADKAKNPAQGDVGKYDVIMEPMFMGGLMHSINSMLSAFYVGIGHSVFAKRIGKKVASRDFTLMDDPLMDSISRRVFDHEGRPTRKSTLIKEGILKTYMHNTSTAKRFRTKPTANTGPLVPQSFVSPAEPTMFHPVIKTGNWSADEMIEETRHGLYMNNTWYTRFQNYAVGDFSTIPRDAILVIRDGEIVGSAKNIRVSDNMLNLLKNVDALSKKPEEIYWWDEAAPPCLLPVVRSSGLTITRSS